MSVAATTTEPQTTLSPARNFALHLWAFFLPLLTTAYLVLGPYAWWQALLWAVPILLLVYCDVKAKSDLRQPDESTPLWPFDVQVYLLTALQIANHILLGVMASKLVIHGWQDVGTLLANLFAMNFVSGVTAGYSGIVVAHELVHRTNRFQYLLGRVLLMFVCYEHFATEHVRGHHPRLGTPADPATARFGETFRDFYRRTVPAQFKSAWHLESKRLGDENMKLLDLRMLQHRVLQGVVAQLLIVSAYFYFFGWVGALFFVMQARTATMLLEVVNYIEHYGISRAGKSVTTFDSWDTDNWFTLYTLVGLSRHSDHHARASRAYQMLRRFEESPKMPHGYYGTILLALTRNERYIAAVTAELKSKKLGPFREARVESVAPATESARSRSGATSATAATA